MVGSFFGNHAFAFQAGLSIWDTVKIFADIIPAIKETEDSATNRLAKYSVRLGLWNAMIGYKKHFNIVYAKGNITNIDLHYNISSLTDLKDEDYGGAYLGFIYQKYNNGPLNYDGYGLSAYVDTTNNILTKSDYDKINFIPWCKFGITYTLGPSNLGILNHTNDYPSLSYLVSWDIILGFGLVYNGFIPICFNIGFNAAIYASDMLDGAPDNISTNEGFIANITIKF